MGFRFRKSKSFGPFRVNVSKSGIGWSVGTKGFRYTKRADGKTQKTYSIPGTGISYVDVKGKNKKSSNINNSKFSNNTNFNNENNSNNDNNDKPKTPFYKKSLFLWLLLIFLPPVGIILMWGTKKYNKKPRIALSIIFALYALVFYTSISTDPNNTNIAQNQTSIQSNNDSEELEQVVTEEQKLAEEQVADEEAEKQRIAQEQAAAEEAERQRIAQEQAAAEEAERERIAQEQAAAQAAAQSQNQASQNVQASQSVGQTVYIAASGNGTKYHSDPNCSRMNGTIQLSVDEAINRGYTACSKCH